MNDTSQLALMLIYHSNLTLLSSFPNKSDIIEGFCFLPKQFDPAAQHLPSEFIDIVIDVATIIDWPNHKKRHDAFCEYKKQMEAIILERFETMSLETRREMFQEVLKISNKKHPE